MCGNNPNLAPEVNTAKCIGGTALGFAIVTVVGILLDWPGFISAAAGILSIIGNSIICCCGPKGKGEGAGKFTAAMVLNIIACVLHFAAIIGVIVFYLAMVATVATETEKCVECVCRDEYRTWGGGSSIEPATTGGCTENPDWTGEDGGGCCAWEGFDCTEAEETWGFTAEGETDLLAACPETCSAYTGRRLQEAQEIEQTLKLAALVGIKADKKHATKARRLQTQEEIAACNALVETEMTADEQAYYETCSQSDDGAKVWCDLANIILVAALTFYLIVMIPTIIFALVAGILEAVAAAKCSAAKAAILADGPSTASV